MRKTVWIGVAVVLLAIAAAYLLNRGDLGKVPEEETAHVSPTSTPVSTPYPTLRPAERRRVTAGSTEFPATPEPSPEPESATPQSFFGSVTIFPNGEPCPGAILRLYSSESGIPAATAIADTHGRYRIENLPYQYYELTAEAPDGHLSAYPAALYQLDKQHQEANREANFILTPSFTIPCRVVDAITEDGVHGAQVTIRKRHSFLPERLRIWNLVADSQGRFPLPGYGIGRHDFTVTAPGYIDKPVYHDVEDDWVLAIVAGRAPAELVIQLEPRTALEVTVRYADGTPGAGLAVWAGELNRGGHSVSDTVRSWSEFMTDGNGHIGLEEVLADRTSRLLVVKVADDPFRAEILAMSEPVSVQRGECRQVEIVIETPGEISGRVLTTSSMPIEGATVTTRILNKHDVECAERSDVTDINGDFSLPAIVPGTVTIDASHPDFEQVSETVLIRPSLETSGVILHMTPAYKIGGTVYSSSGNPFIDAYALLYPPRVEDASKHYVSLPEPIARSITTNDGRFVFHSLAPGNYRLEVGGNVQAFGHDYPRMMTRRFGNIPAGTTNLRVVLGEGPSAYGRVVDAGSGAPVTEFDIIWRQLWNTNPKDYAHGGRQHYSDPSGEFRMKHLREGWDFYLEVNAEGYARTRTDLFDLLDAEEHGPIIVGLPLGYEVTGRAVKGDTGEPLVNCAYRFEPIPYHLADRDALWFPAKTDSSGQFKVQDVAPGPYQIVFDPTAQTFEEQFMGGTLMSGGSREYKECELGPFEIQGSVDLGDLKIPRLAPDEEPRMFRSLEGRWHDDGF